MWLGLPLRSSDLHATGQLLQQLADNAMRPKSISEYVTELQGIYEEVLLERRGNK